MTDAELKAAFPFGAMLIPREEESPSTRVVVGQEWEDEDYPEYFRVWRDPYRELLLSRDLTESSDGWVTASGSGDKYFLRPLTEEQGVDF